MLKEKCQPICCIKFARRKKAEWKMMTLIKKAVHNDCDGLAPKSTTLKRNSCWKKGVVLLTLVDCPILTMQAAHSEARGV